MMKISNIKKELTRSKPNGFTLMELLVVIVVVIIVGTVAAQIIASSLRGTNKSNLIETVRQNGNYAISQMAKTIEFAEKFEGLSTDGVSFETGFPYITPTLIPPLVSRDYKAIKIKPFNGESIIYECVVASPPSVAATVASNGASLLDTSAIKVDSCGISRMQSKTTDVPIIKIKLQLSPKTPSTLIEKYLPPVTFERSMTIRNYIRQ